MLTLIKVIKPGIIGGNIIAATGGFFLASKGSVDWVLLVNMLLGLSLVIASGCTLNNCIDRDIDALMKRTCKRVTVTGEVSLYWALIYGLLLGVAGFVILGLYTTTMALFFAAFGYFIYVIVYSLYMKRHSVYGTVIGSLSGAVPPVVGYCAVTGQFDFAVIILLAMFSLWQMPHAYAIAIYRHHDYEAAKLPVLPVAEGFEKGRERIVLYIVVFALVSLLLPISGYTGVVFFVTALATSLWWLVMALRGYRQDIDIRRWARQIFGLSVVNITALSVVMALDY